MAIEYGMDPDRGLWHVVIRGELTLEEILRSRAEVLEHPDFDPALPQLIEVERGTRIRVGTPDLRELGRDEKQAMAKRARRVIVAPDDVAFGLARLYEFTVGRRYDVLVVRSLEEADGALGLKAKPTAESG